MTTDTEQSLPQRRSTQKRPTSLDPLRLRYEFAGSGTDRVRRRIDATRFPERETVADDIARRPARHDSETGALLGDGARLAQVSRRRLNALPHFITEIDGLDIHFIHVRSKHENALPLIVTHGWPGSIIEQLKIIEPLTNPTAHGGSASDAFHLVIPSMPGYGFSGKPTAAGWGPERIARAWATLMERLGYQRYAAQGGDWGALIVDMMGVQAPPGLVGIHTNMAGAIPSEVDAAAFAGAARRLPAWTKRRKLLSTTSRSSTSMVSAMPWRWGNRPQTLYGLEDSPVALAAWIIDHDIWTYRHNRSRVRRRRRGPDAGRYSRQHHPLLADQDGGIVGSPVLGKQVAAFFAPKGVKIPVVVSAFPEEICPIPRKWAEKAYPKLVYYRRHPKGAHFAAWEQPQAIVDDLRAGFKSLR